MTTRPNPLIGKWELGAYRDVVCGPYTVCRLEEGRIEEAEEAANLIAAAPDMLKALRLVADYFMGDDEIPEHIATAIDAAIAKTRGTP